MYFELYGAIQGRPDNRFTKRKTGIDVPDILIHCTASRSAKQWNMQGWIEVLEWCYQRE